jgi:hypothetical protein
MSEMKPCKATKVFHGLVIRCEGLAGHDSAHFGEGKWWPNEKGMPIVAGVTNRTLTWFACLVVFGTIAAAIILWLALR